MKKKIITIAGKLGSGKSSTAKKIAKLLNLEHFSSGDLMRSIGKERGLSIKEIALVAETDLSVDKQIDDILKSMINKENIIIDSRLAFHWIPDSFRVYLDINSDVASKRMFQDLEDNESRKRSEYSESIKEMKQHMLERHESDVRRYQKLYGIDHTDHNNFDLVIDTGLVENDLEAVVKMIISEYLKICKDC